jgi:maleylacetoacetate isomerase
MNRLMAPKLQLYCYYRSSCSARIRTAANLKGLDFETIYVNTSDPDKTPEEYKKLNPSATVPTLVVIDASSDQKATITQSVAILEYLEEAFPESRPLLPKDPLQRAKVREFVSIVCSDLQPLTNSWVVKYLKPWLNTADYELYTQDRALRAFDRLLAGSQGEYCVGDSISLADVVLVPAAENAQRFKYSLSNVPNFKAMYEKLKVLPEFRKASWRNQADTPLELREEM